MNTPKNINMWSGPRNISTTLMYSFAQRADTRVVDEPLYAYYLAKTGIEHPGREEVLASQSQNGQQVMQELSQPQEEGKTLFIKNMAQHYLDLDGRAFIPKMKHFLLIRRPDQVINSFAKVIPEPNLNDIGIVRQHEIYQELKALGQQPIVLDSNEVLKNPSKVLEELCLQLGIPFDPHMLVWEKGARDEDGVWAKYWYTAVHSSTGFKPWREKQLDLSPELKELEKKAWPYYEQLFRHSIKA